MEISQWEGISQESDAFVGDVSKGVPECVAGGICLGNAAWVSDDERSEQDVYATFS